MALTQSQLQFKVIPLVALNKEERSFLYAALRCYKHELNKAIQEDRQDNKGTTTPVALAMKYCIKSTTDIVKKIFENDFVEDLDLLPYLRNHNKV